MPTITTAHILGRRALQKACGQECVDWATAMLVDGHDGETLVELAGMSPPYSHFELAPLRDRALCEIGAPDLGPDRAIEAYVAEVLQLMLAGEADIGDTLRDLKDLSVMHDHAHGLSDFYVLYHARDTLQDYTVQHYWDGATRENIDDIVWREAEAFVRNADAARER